MRKKHFVHSTSGIELVRKLAENENFIFTVKQAEEIAPSVGISINYLRQVLHHLNQAGWIIRLKNGLYSLSGTIPGVSPLHEFQIAMALVHPASISHWSALNYHHLTEQTPRHVFILTSARSIPRSRGIKATHKGKGYLIDKTLYQFVQTQPKRFFGIQEIWVNDSKINMTDKERTLLDCLMAPEYCGGFSEVLHIFEKYYSELDLRKMIRYALKLDTATIKRLGWILEQQGIEFHILKPLQKVAIKGYRLLHPSGAQGGQYNNRWMIQENLKK